MAGKLALGAGAFVLAVALPSAVYAVGKLADSDSSSISSTFASFTPASVDPSLARIIAERSNGTARMMRFTPAGVSESDSRSVTVAVRLGAQSAQAISGLSGSDGPRESAASESGLRISSTRYNLGLARGYRSFAQSAAPRSAVPSASLSTSLSSARIPDLAEFRPSPGAKDEPSRFAARVELEESTAAQETARVGDQMVDVGGSFRLTRNLDVTAGVRYQQERDLRALPELDKQDSQAVYIGTQFRF